LFAGVWSDMSGVIFGATATDDVTGVGIRIVLVFKVPGCI
jgi:hypothetical protein